MDIKPRNVLIGSDLKLKLADFDSSYVEYVDSKIRGSGTCSFRSEELHNRTCTKPKAADIFSLGLLLFVLFTGNYAFIEGETLKGHDLQSMVMNSEDRYWKISAELSATQEIKDEEFKSLFFSMVKKDPKDRLTIEQVIESKWYNGEVYGDEEYKRELEKYLKTI